MVVSMVKSNTYIPFDATDIKLKNYLAVKYAIQFPFDATEVTSDGFYC
jgi:hypothetical protein